MSTLFGSAWATISPCGTYRHTLGRTWDDSLPLVCWVMLNPSTADASTDDPTIRRVAGFSRSWGYGRFVVVNLYALRATDPKELWRHPDPVGSDNDQYVLANCTNSDVVVAWGTHAREGRWRATLNLLRQNARTVQCLGTTKGGYPRHPLYVRADTVREDYP